MTKMKNKEIESKRNQNEKGAVAHRQGLHEIEMPGHLQRRTHGRAQKVIPNKRGKDVRSKTPEPNSRIRSRSWPRQCGGNSIKSKATKMALKHLQDLMIWTPWRLCPSDQTYQRMITMPPKQLTTQIKASMINLSAHRISIKKLNPKARQKHFKY